ncbi:MAG: phosphocholine cytidylyltransferase family protein [Myxococcota bacterium]|nr:phosphocholine cytidylyltransferase family protein [Myxococcota bacterium]
MKAIILSAGQGSRLLPYTERTPKCLLPVLGERSVLEFQLAALAECGIREVSVMVGFAAEQVESLVDSKPVDGLQIRTQYNPFYDTTDNLVTCWLARPEMFGEFVLLNGDTLFEPEVLRRLLDSARAPVTLAVNQKPEYDADDMKVTLEGQRLTAVGKQLEPEATHAESIGLMCFRNRGPAEFRGALERAVRTSRGRKAWYLSVISSLAQSLTVETTLINGLWWGEIDGPEDLHAVRAELSRGESKPLEPTRFAAARA